MSKTGESNIIQQFKAAERRCEEAVKAITGVTTYIWGSRYQSELSDRPVGVDERCIYIIHAYHRHELLNMDEEI